MMAVLSKAAGDLDISATSFTGAARDLGEVIAILSGGIRPDAETLSRLCLSLRLLRSFMLHEADEHAGREALSGDRVLAAAIAAVVRTANLATVGGADAA